MNNRIAAALSLGLLFLAPLSAVADPCAEGDASSACAQDAGQLHGTVTEIDYRQGQLRLVDSRHRHFHVSISPSTAIGSNESDADEYHAITDIRVGSQVTIEASRRGREYDAQSVEIERR
jgi:hypothetical protein